jgi:hypothetical protein
MAVRDSTALHIHDIFGQAELPRYRNGNRSKGLVDLDALDVADLPAGSRQRLLHGGHRP